LPQSGPSDRLVEIDWAALFWRLRLASPNEQRFIHENFGNCLLMVVEQALEALNEHELQAANRAALPIALLGLNLLATHGVEARIDSISPLGKILAQREALAE
jgi:hypothetical protein